MNWKLTVPILQLWMGTRLIRFHPKWLILPGFLGALGRGFYTLNALIHKYNDLFLSGHYPV